MNLTFEIAKWFLITIIVLITISYIRKKYAERISITAIDLSISILPFLIWLILSGYLTEAKIGDISFKILMDKAQSKKIEEKNIDLLDVRPTPSALKAGIGQIDYIVEEQKEALVFSLGYSNYSEDAIAEYIRKLLGTTLKFIVFEKQNDKSFAGIIDFNSFAQQMLGPESSEIGLPWFALVLKNGTESELNKLKGFISNKYSLNSTNSRAFALEQATKINSEYLPFVNPNNEFIGIVTQSRLSSLILLDLYKQTNSENQR